jgi:hypothetical protein
LLRAQGEGLSRVELAAALEHLAFGA